MKLKISNSKPQITNLRKLYFSSIVTQTRQVYLHDVNRPVWFCKKCVFNAPAKAGDKEKEPV